MFRFSTGEVLQGYFYKLKQEILVKMLRPAPEHDFVPNRQKGGLSRLTVLAIFLGRIFLFVFFAEKLWLLGFSVFFGFRFFFYHLAVRISAKIRSSWQKYTRFLDAVLLQVCMNFNAEIWIFDGGFQSYWIAKFLQSLAVQWRIFVICLKYEQTRQGVLQMSHVRLIRGPNN